MNKIMDNCSILAQFPTPDEFRSSLGSTLVIVLYGFSGVISTILFIEYLFMLYKFIQYVPKERLKHTMWINAVYFIVALFTSISVILPKSGPFVWSLYKVVVGIAMAKFVDLLMIWSVGFEEAILTN
jgi:hypothetical protein